MGSLSTRKLKPRNAKWIPNIDPVLLIGDPDCAQKRGGWVRRLQMLSCPCLEWAV